MEPAVPRKKPSFKPLARKGTVDLRKEPSDAELQTSVAAAAQPFKSAEVAAAEYASVLLLFWRLVRALFQRDSRPVPEVQQLQEARRHAWQLEEDYS